MSRLGNIRRLEELASEQWGLITAAQAIRVGSSRTQLSRMVSDGRLEPMCYGVYQVTSGSETDHAMLKAAWMSLYPKKYVRERVAENRLDAVATGRTAARLYGYGDLYESPYCFVVMSGKRSTRRDMELVRDTINVSDVSFEMGIPVVRPERMIADLLRTNEDPSLVDDAIADMASKGHVLDRRRLAILLEPLSKRHGYDSGDIMASSLIDRNATVPLVSKSLSNLTAALESSEEWRRLTSIVSENLSVISAAQEASRSLPSSEMIDNLSAAVQAIPRAGIDEHLFGSAQSLVSSMRAVDGERLDEWKEAACISPAMLQVIESCQKTIAPLFDSGVIERMSEVLKTIGPVISAVRESGASADRK